jgi:anti-sigma-K factor RskA
MHIMKLALVAITVTLSVIAGVSLLNSQSMQANAQGNATAPMITQSGALIGYGGQIFGLVDVSTNDHQTRINIASDFLPPAGKVFEVWMVDGNYAASGYPLSLGQLSATGTMRYNENFVFAPTYTDLIVTLEPDNDKDPKPAWSQAIAGYWMIPPFGQ